MQKMMCVLMVHLPIHLMNKAPEDTINRTSRGDNKEKISGSDNVDEWMWMQLTMGLGEKANAVTTQIKVKRNEYNVNEVEYM